MNIITRFLLWRDKRALARIRLALSLLIDPQYVNTKDDAALIDELLTVERQRAESHDLPMRSLMQLAKDFEFVWRMFAENADQEIVREKIQAYAESLMPNVARQTTQENAQ